jgi:hypothetical protein
MGHRGLRMLVGLLLVAGAAGLFGAIARSPEKFERDFATYYYSAAAYASGENPYNASLPAGVSGEPIHVKFVYPPHVLPLFSWTTLLPFEKARLVWLAAKGAFLLLLLLLWQTILRPEKPDVWFYAFAALAFNGAILIDLTTGNVTIIEQAILWGGFLAFTKERWLWFALLVAASALFKLTNGLFLLLLLAVPARKGGLPFAAGVIGIAAPLVISVLRWPVLSGAFLGNANGLLHPGERGSSNPCLWAFLADTRDVAASLTGWEIRESALDTVFVLHATAVIAFTSRAVRRLLRSGRPNRFLLAVSLASLAFPLVVPRFKDYSFILLIPPSYVMLRRAVSLRAASLLVAFIVCLPTTTSFRLFMPVAEYHLLFVTYGLWLLMLAHARMERAEAPEPGEVPTGRHDYAAA